MTLYTQVASNRFKTVAYLGLYIVLIWAIGYLFAWYFGNSSLLLIAGVISIVQGIVAYWLSDQIALGVSHAVPLDQARFGRVYRLVENLCMTAGLPMPKLYLLPDRALNAFATGRDPKHASLAVTEGLVSALDDNELAGVLAHELTHVGNEDIRLMSMVSVMAGLIALVSDLALRSLWWGGRDDDRERGGNSLSPIFLVAALVLAPIAATLIQLAISRKREFMADAGAVLLTRYPEGLISALRKIGSDPRPTEEATSATAHMYFSNPLRSGWLASLFSTHPPIGERIAALHKGSGMLP